LGFGAGDFGGFKAV
jgi:hypothetical protein